MERPKYKIGEKEIQLAEPTPNRIAQFLKLHGKKKLSELFYPDDVEATATSAGKYALDLTGDSESAAQLLTACLVDPVSAEIAGNIDVDVIAKIDLDFFLTLILKQRLQVK